MKTQTLLAPLLLSATLGVVGCQSDPDDAASGADQAVTSPGDALFQHTGTAWPTVSGNAAFYIARRSVDGAADDHERVLKVDLDTHAVESVVELGGPQLPFLAVTGNTLVVHDSDANGDGVFRVIDLATKSEHTLTLDDDGTLMALVGRPDGVFAALRPDASHIRFVQIDSAGKASEAARVDGTNLLALVVGNGAFTFVRTTETNDDNELVVVDRASKKATVMAHGNIRALSTDPNATYTYYTLETSKSTLEVRAIENGDTPYLVPKPIATIDHSRTLSVLPFVNASKIVWVEYKDHAETLESLTLDAHGNAGKASTDELAIPHIETNTQVIGGGSHGVLVDRCVVASGPCDVALEHL